MSASEPSEAKPMSNTLKAVLEYGPLLMLLVGVVLRRDRTTMLFGAERSGLVLMTAIFIPVMALAMFVQWRLTRKLSPMQIVTLVLVVVFGGLTIWLNDERFFKMKPTLIYLLFAGLLGFGLLRGKSYLQLVIGDNIALSDVNWMKMTRRMCVFFVVLAAANEAVWRTQTTPVWVTFKIFGFAIALFLFMMSQYRLISDPANLRENQADEPK